MLFLLIISFEKEAEKCTSYVFIRKGKKKKKKSSSSVYVQSPAMSHFTAPHGKHTTSIFQALTTFRCRLLHRYAA